MNKRIVDVVDRAVGSGTRSIKMSGSNYRTFVRLVFGRVYDGRNRNEFVIYKGVTVSMLNGESDGKET